MNFPTISGEKMRDIDLKITETIGVERIMAIVASRTAEFIKYHLQIPKEKNICFVTSKGNNGGDGIGTARILHGWGYNVSLYSTHTKEELGKETKIQFDLFKKFGGNVTYEIPQKDSIIVDAIFGTGLESYPYGKLSDIITQINESDTKVLSLDLPSGLHSTKGKIFKPCIKADRTITYHIPKEGLIQNEAKNYVGNLYVTEAGLTFDQFPKIQDQLEKLYENNTIIKLT